jgi:hypothetical protein
MNETHILNRLLRMYIPRNWEFGSALAKLRNFVGGGGIWAPPNPPSVRHWHPHITLYMQTYLRLCAHLCLLFHTENKNIFIASRPRQNGVLFCYCSDGGLYKTTLCYVSFISPDIDQNTNTWVNVIVGAKHRGSHPSAFWNRKHAHTPWYPHYASVLRLFNAN